MKIPRLGKNFHLRLTTHNMKKVDPYSPRGQTILLLLAALHVLKKSRTKKEVIDFIEDKKWFNLEDEDKIPYKSQQGVEPRWKTLIAWSRKDCVDLGFMESDVTDSWLAKKEGLNLVVRLKSRCESGEFEVGRCFLWTHSLKEFYDPKFQSSGQDVPRPRYMYRDSFSIMLQTLKGEDLMNRLLDDL